jgi:DNA-binding transcriptional MerR regulator
MEPTASLWTLDELCGRVAEVLAEDTPKGRDGRVREVPDRRTIRYYTTLGVVDRPAELRGRTAYYSRKHLLQLVAIKRLQSRGLTLAQVQQHLLGLNEDELNRLALLPAAAEPQAASTPEPATRRDDFWRTVPAPTPPAEVTPSGGGLTPVCLGADVILTLAAARPLREEDLAALRAAAAPLLDLLRARGLLRPAIEDNGEDTP